MSHELRELAKRPVWIVDLDSLFSNQPASSPNGKSKIGQSDASQGLRTAIRNVHDRGGDVLYIAQRPENVERPYGFGLPLTQEEITGRIFTSADLPNLRRSLNGGNIIPASSAVLIGSDPQMAADFNDLGVGVVWLDMAGPELNGERDALVQRDNLVRVTIAKYIFLLMQRPEHGRNSHDAQQTAPVNEHFLA